MKLWQEDVTPLFDATGITLHKRPLLASFGKATYEFTQDLRANWLFYAFLAFQKLALEIKKPELVATVGVGSGLDGIALHETLRPQNLMMIDVHPGVIGVARSNLRGYFKTIAPKQKWSVVLGNLCSPLKMGTADLIYANIPSMPGRPSRIFSGMNSSSFFDPAWVPLCAKNLRQNFLALQSEFLFQAMEKLKPGGSVVVALGVRMDADIVEYLFRHTAGYENFEAIVLDLKEQSQPEVVVAAHAKQEQKAGASFDFYTEHALTHMPDTLKLKDFKRALKPWRISATEALTLSKRGEKVYHVIAILRAKKCR